MGNACHAEAHTGRGGRTSIWAVLWDQWCVHIIVPICDAMINILLTLMGFLVINYFGPSMYVALGLTHGQSLLVQGIYGAVGPIANFM